MCSPDQLTTEARLSALPAALAKGMEATPPAITRKWQATIVRPARNRTRLVWKMSEVAPTQIRTCRRSYATALVLARSASRPAHPKRIARATAPAHQAASAHQVLLPVPVSQHERRSSAPVLSRRKSAAALERDVRLCLHARTRISQGQRSGMGLHERSLQPLPRRAPFGLPLRA